MLNSTKPCFHNRKQGYFYAFSSNNIMLFYTTHAISKTNLFATRKCLSLNSCSCTCGFCIAAEILSALSFLRFVCFSIFNTPVNKKRQRFEKIFSSLSINNTVHKILNVLPLILSAKHRFSLTNRWYLSALIIDFSIASLTILISGPLWGTDARKLLYLLE